MKMSVKTFAMLLVFIAFLAGAFLSVLDPRQVQWNLLAPVLVVGAAGLWLYRRSHHSEARSGERLAGNTEILRSRLVSIVTNLEGLAARGDDLPVYQARFEIDRLFRDDLNDFAEARESMIHVFGLQNYADVMSHFAAGERYINRVWSASTDGYVDEVRMYIERALSQFRVGSEHFNELLSEHRERSD